MRFSHTVKTAASPEAIWSIWTAVDKWPEWDFELKRARLDGAFRLGAAGRLIPKVGPSSRFVISQLAPTKSYTFTTQLLFSELKVYRFLHFCDGGMACGDRKLLCFTHEVSFVGPLAFLFNFLLGRRFRRALPGAMQQLNQLAESQLLHPATVVKKEGEKDA